MDSAQRDEKPSPAVEQTAESPVPEKQTFVKIYEHKIIYNWDSLYEPSLNKFEEEIEATIGIGYNLEDIKVVSMLAKHDIRGGVMYIGIVYRASEQILTNDADLKPIETYFLQESEKQVAQREKEMRIEEEDLLYVSHAVHDRFHSPHYSGFPHHDGACRDEGCVNKDGIALCTDTGSICYRLPNNFGFYIYNKNSGDPARFAEYSWNPPAVLKEVLKGNAKIRITAPKGEKLDTYEYFYIDHDGKTLVRTNEGAEGGKVGSIEVDSWIGNETFHTEAPEFRKRADIVASLLNTLSQKAGIVQMSFFTQGGETYGVHHGSIISAADKDAFTKLKAQMAEFLEEHKIVMSQNKKGIFAQLPILVDDDGQPPEKMQRL